MTNLNGVSAAVLPLLLSVFAVFTTEESEPTVTALTPITAEAVKSTKVEVTVEPGVTDVDVGVAPAF
jgi:hypothetical protein